MFSCNHIAIRPLEKLVWSFTLILKPLFWQAGREFIFLIYTQSKHINHRSAKKRLSGQLCPKYIFCSWSSTWAFLADLFVRRTEIVPICWRARIVRLIVGSSRIVKPICGWKSQEEDRAQKRNATASVRPQKWKSRAQKWKTCAQKASRAEKGSQTAE